MEQHKIAIITGGSRGIGAATSMLFAKHGYAVCINYKSKSAPAEHLARCIREQGGKCITVQADVANEQDVERLFATVDQQLGKVSVLINNAGILKPQMRLQDMTAQRINEVLINNVTSYFYLRAPHGEEKRQAC